MKKFMSIALALVMGLSLAACGGGGNTAGTPENPAETTDAPSGDNAEPAPQSAEGKKYIIATDTSFAPFEFDDASGNFVGVDVEILDEIAKDQGFEYEWQRLGFNAAVQAVEVNQADGVIAGMSITEDRQQKFDFSDAYYDSGVVMGIAATNEDIKAYEDLSGKDVAVKVGTEGASFADSLKDQYGFNVVTFDDSAMMYDSVTSGDTVACFEDFPVLGYNISVGAKMKIVTEKEQGSAYGFAVNKGKNPELLEMFNAGLKNLRDSGKYQEILDKYIVTE